MTFVIMIIYSSRYSKKERNKEDVVDSRAMPLPNKNRWEKAKHMKRDERTRHIRLSLVDIYVPSRLHSHLSSFTHTIITQNDIGSMVYKRSDRIFDMPER
jgi:hypothetical protein